MKNRAEKIEKFRIKMNFNLDFGACRDAGASHSLCLGDHTIWERYTSIERYVSKMNLAVVMPNAHRCFYSDMKYGPRYWTFISEELPQIVKAFFPISTQRKDTFVAGASMGGYGALKLALRCPEKIAAAASLSGTTDINSLWIENARFKKDLFYAFCNREEFIDSKDDLFKLSCDLKKSGKDIPVLFQCCGTEDFLYKDNIRFRNHLQELDYELHYQESPGTHGWDFWDRNIQDILNWLPFS